MKTLPEFLKRFDEPEIKDGKAKYKGFTHSEYINAPLGFKEVMSLCEHPYHVVWVCANPYAILEYCEHDITLNIYPDVGSFNSDYSDYLWHFAIPDRISRAAKIFYVKERQTASGVEQWYATRSIEDEFTMKLFSLKYKDLDFEVDNFHYEWAHRYLSEFYEKVNTDTLLKIRNSGDLLDKILDEIDSTFTEPTYFSEHSEWLSRTLGRIYIDELLAKRTRIKSFEELCLAGERLERKDFRGIIKEFLLWLMFDYEDEELWKIADSNTHRPSYTVTT